MWTNLEVFEVVESLELIGFMNEDIMAESMVLGVQVRG